MHLRLTPPFLALALLTVLVDPAWGQAPSALQPARVQAPLRQAGTYHLATGTWTRSGLASPQAGPDVIYSNATTGNYWTGELHESGAEWVDEGQVPGIASPFGADRSCYRVNGFELAYGTSSLPGTLTLDLHLYDSYEPCANPGVLTSCIARAGSATGIDLPENGGVGTAFWLMTIDLAGGGEIAFGADGGPCSPGHDGFAEFDSFGWGAVPHGGSMGWILAGDPDWTPAVLGGTQQEIGGSGTYYGVPSACSGDTGLNTQDLWRVVEPLSGGTLATGCYWWGGYSNPLGCGLGPLTPFASQHFRLFAESTAGAACNAVPDVRFSLPGTPHCGTNTSGAPQGPAYQQFSRDPSGQTLGVLQTLGGPAGEFSMVLASASLGVGVPVGSGTLYLEPPFGRYDLAAGVQNPGMVGLGQFLPSGINENLHGNGGPQGLGFQVPLQRQGVLGGGTWAPGERVAFATWFRCGSGSNVSDAVEILIQ